MPKKSSKAKKKTTTKKSSQKKTQQKAAKKSKKTTKKAVKKTKVSKAKAKDEIDWSYLKPWANKLPNETVQSLKKRVIKKMNFFRKKYPKWSDDRVHGKARLRIFLEIKNSMSSNGDDFYVRKIYGGKPFDFGAKHVKDNLAYYKANPKQAKNEGYVRIEIKNGARKAIAIDERKKFKSGWENKNHGEPLPLHSWIMSLGFIAIPCKAMEQENMDELLPATLTLNNAYADPTNIDQEDEEGNVIPGKYLGDAFEEEGWYKCRFVVKKKRVPEGQEPEPITSYDLLPTSARPEFTDIEDVDEETIKAVFDNVNVPLLELNEYHDVMTQDYVEAQESKGKEVYKTSNNNIMMVQGQVSSIQLSDGTNSHLVKIDSDEDLSFGDEDTEGVDSTPIWFDKDLPINFGLYSEIIVFGSTSRTRKKDFQTNEYTSEWNQTSIAGKGYIITELVQPDDEEEDSEEFDEEYSAEDGEYSMDEDEEPEEDSEEEDEEEDEGKEGTEEEEEETEAEEDSEEESTEKSEEWNLDKD